MDIKSKELLIDDELSSVFGGCGDTPCSMLIPHFNVNQVISIKLPNSGIFNGQTFSVIVVEATRKNDTDYNWYKIALHGVVDEWIRNRFQRKCGIWVFGEDPLYGWLLKEDSDYQPL